MCWLNARFSPSVGARTVWTGAAAVRRGQRYGTGKRREHNTNKRQQNCRNTQSNCMNSTSTPLDLLVVLVFKHLFQLLCHHVVLGALLQSTTGYEQTADEHNNTTTLEGELRPTRHTKLCQLHGMLALLYTMQLSHTKCTSLAQS